MMSPLLIGCIYSVLNIVDQPVHLTNVSASDELSCRWLASMTSPNASAAIEPVQSKPLTLLSAVKLETSQCSADIDDYTLRLSFSSTDSLQYGSGRRFPLSRNPKTNATSNSSLKIIPGHRDQMSPTGNPIVKSVQQRPKRDKAKINLTITPRPITTQRRKPIRLQMPSAARCSRSCGEERKGRERQRWSENFIWWRNVSEDRYCVDVDK
jgi:hypothetical protein